MASSTHPEWFCYKKYHLKKKLPAAEFFFLKMTSKNFFMAITWINLGQNWSISVPYGIIHPSLMILLQKVLFEKRMPAAEFFFFWKWLLIFFHGCYTNKFGTELINISIISYHLPIRSVTRISVIPNGNSMEFPPDQHFCFLYQLIFSFFRSIRPISAIG